MTRESFRQRIQDAHNTDLLARHTRWYRVHASLPVVWGAWLMLAQSYQTSATYSAARALGDEWVVGVTLLALGLCVHGTLSLQRSLRCALLFSSLLLAVVWGAMCGLFAIGNIRSTGVPVYAFLTMCHLLAYREILLETYEEVPRE